MAEEQREAERQRAAVAVSDMISPTLLVSVKFHALPPSVGSSRHGGFVSMLLLDRLDAHCCFIGETL